MKIPLQFKIIQIIAKDAGLGPYHTFKNAPLMEKLGFLTRIQKKTPKNTGNRVWIKLDSFPFPSECGKILWIGMDKQYAEKILTLGFMPIPENWPQTCKHHWENNP